MRQKRLTKIWGKGKNKSKFVQCKYRKAAHMKVALANGVLGEKMMVDSVFNCLVNDQGELLLPHGI